MSNYQIDKKVLENKIIDFQKTNGPISYEDLMKQKDKFYYGEDSQKEWNEQINKGLDFIENKYGKKAREDYQRYLNVLSEGKI